MIVNVSNVDIMHEPYDSATYKVQLNMSSTSSHNLDSVPDEYDRSNDCIDA